MTTESLIYSPNKKEVSPDLNLEKEKQLINDPLLVFEINKNNKIAFEDYNTYDPKVAAGEEIGLPEHIKEYISKRKKLNRWKNQELTYDKTKEIENWEEKIFNFIKDFLQCEGGQILEHININLEDLTKLSPKEAVDLTLKLVIQLTKYNSDDNKDVTEADNSSALKLLKQGRDNTDNEKWGGNGKCRNFAAMVKAVFESLKNNQNHKLSRLNSTYCLIDSGAEYDPKYNNPEDFDKFDLNSRHSWNIFMTLSEDSSTSTIVDATFGKYDLDTGEEVDIDQTLTRIEPVVFNISEKTESSKKRKEQLYRVLSYYFLKAGIKVMNTGELDDRFKEKEKNKEKQRYFLFKAWRLAQKKELVKLPDKFIKRIKQEFEQNKKTLYKEDIEFIWKLKKNGGIDFSLDKIVKNYIETKPKFSYLENENRFEFDDEGLQNKINNNK